MVNEPKTWTARMTGVELEEVRRITATLGSFDSKAFRSTLARYLAIRRMFDSDVTDVIETRDAFGWDLHFHVTKIRRIVDGGWDVTIAEGQEPPPQVKPMRVPGL